LILFTTNSILILDMTTISDEELNDNYFKLLDNLEYCKYIVIQLKSGNTDEQLFENAFEFMTFLIQKFNLYNEYISFDSSNIIYSDLSQKSKNLLDFIYKSFQKFYYLIRQLEIKGENEEYVMSNDYISLDFINIFNTAIIIQNKMIECFKNSESEKIINYELVTIIDNLKII
jgi:hypothetical protein